MQTASALYVLYFEALCHEAVRISRRRFGADMSSRDMRTASILCTNQNTHESNGEYLNPSSPSTRIAFR